MPIQELAGFVDHYYLSETLDLDDSVGWGVNGIELHGVVNVTPEEFDRINSSQSPNTILPSTTSISRCDREC